ncbi:MAG: radical SAM protein [Candidatus Desulfofervidaceae bacterium]|nr:radical SAM protein [Candidatus Desulfofervidaceae bacterium]
MKYIFGPVPSRRLGLSLGLDLVPFKTCSYNCVYCELGKTSHLTIQRSPYVSAEAILTELDSFFADKGHPPVDFITLGGSGEPTLNINLGTIIEGAKALKKAPVAVLTNGSLLWQEEVTKALLQADVILPSLDAVFEESWQRINRPHPHLKLGTVIKGLKDFRQQYTGQIWLEILFVRGINDTEKEIEAMQVLLQEIAPEKIHLNTVVRPPAESEIKPLTEAELEKIRQVLGPKAEIVVQFSRHIEVQPSLADLKSRILAMLTRRPCTLKDIADALGIHINTAIKIVDELQKTGLIQTYIHVDKRYYVGKSHG